VPQTCGNLLIHLIFSTKERKPLITPSFRSGLLAYLGGIVRGMQGTALCINGTTDHVHMLVRIRPSQSVAEIARVVKTNSSRWLHEKGEEGFAWQAGYGAFSVSESNVRAVTEYIGRQEQHHARRPFRKSSWPFSRKTALRMTSDMSGTRSLSPLRGWLPC
jgi:putative transposase